MRNLSRFCFCIFAACLANPVASAATPPPVAPVRPVVDTYFGTKVTDNYRWMENLKDPEMQRWMKAQANYTRATLDALPGYQKLLARIHELDSSQAAHVKGVQIVGGRYYSLRTPANAQSPKLYVRNDVHGKDKLLIDPEKIPGNGKSHYTIHDFSAAPDGRYVAYTIAAGGSEKGVLHILDVSTGKDLPETADRVYFGAPYWRPDSRAFFYTRGQVVTPGMPRAAKFQNARACLHVLGRPFEKDRAILGHGVPGSAIAVSSTEFPFVVTASNSRYAIAIVFPGTDPRLRVYAAPLTDVKDGKVAWRAVAPSYDDQFIGGSDGFSIALVGNTLYWLSRKNAPRGEILKLDLSHADSMPQVAVAQGDLPISDVYAGKTAIYWRLNDAGVYSVHRLKIAPGAKPESLMPPYAANIAAVVTDIASNDVAMVTSSWLRSFDLMGADLDSTKLVETGLQPTGPFDNPSDLTVEEVRVKSWDGTLVPLSIIHRKDMRLNSSNRVLLTAYGAYGISLSPSYAPPLRSWYDRGNVLAVAHVRGGGELGEAWHKAGYKANKPNGWKDFIACAQYLVDHRYTSPQKLIGFAQSAGTIILGRAIEERPDLFGVVVIRVPAADMLRFQNTAIGPANVSESGDVHTRDGFKALYAMSPYAHVRDGVKYPAIIIYAGANDPRTPEWMPAKFAARLQAATASGKPVLLRVDYDAGHTGFDATRAQHDRDTADQFAFALWQTGDPAFQPKH